VDLLWYSLVAAYILGAAIYFGLGHSLPRCPECHVSALILSRQLTGSSPPVFEVVYHCPHCHKVLWKRFISAVSD
jgi:uncharacterized protein with PIN domain